MTYNIKVTEKGVSFSWVYENHTNHSFEDIDERLKPYVAMLDAADNGEGVVLKGIGTKSKWQDGITLYYIANEVVNPDAPGDSYTVKNMGKS